VRAGIEQFLELTAADELMITAIMNTRRLRSFESPEAPERR
jgi:hypothetical protein